MRAVALLEIKNEWEETIPNLSINNPLEKTLSDKLYIDFSYSPSAMVTLKSRRINLRE